MDIKEFNHQTKEPKQNHPWEYARFMVVHDLIKRKILKTKLFQNKQSLTIVDIGCGDCFFLKKLTQKIPNLNCYAIDSAFDDESITYFSEKNKHLPIKFLKPSQMDQIIENKVDIVILLDVIEHIEDDVSFIDNIIKLPYITSETQFVITVPAFKSLFCSHDKWLGHYRRYSLNELRDVVKKLKLKTIYDGYFFFLLLIARWLKVRNEKGKNIDLSKVSGIGSWNGSSFKSNIISKILYFDYYISKIKRFVGISLPGLSCYSICQKR